MPGMTGFEAVEQSLTTTLLRSYRSRKLAAQGAARQRNLLAMYEKLAESYARRLSYDVLHVVVQQELLPFLWRGGHLGGRTFDVLMTALPMNELQATLDAAAHRHPESKTLGDFRADNSLLEVESEALRHSRKIVTPHTHIASLFGERAELLAWKMPPPAPRDRPVNEKPVVVFPTSTVGRKGCYELRDALRGTEAKLITLGPHIEGADFWDGFDIVSGDENWLDNADLVVLPAHVEHRPRRLLLAAASGIPVIATPNCGAENIEGIKTVAAGDALELRSAMKEFLK
jgi:hypothetical protein